VLGYLRVRLIKQRAPSKTGLFGLIRDPD
jgi:hypothetical protein